MILLLAVLAVLSAAFLFWAVKRRQLQAGDEARTFDPSALRPLFEPTPAELRAATAEQEAREIAKRQIASRSQEREQIDTAIRAWRDERTIGSAGELLATVAEAGDAHDFSRAAEEIIDHYRGGGLTAASAHGVADLLESHRLLLPVTERGSGTLLWLKEEVARLRSFTGGDAAETTN